jgi:hypothetical protein
MQELAPERHAVREAIESLRLTPVMFELERGRIRRVLSTAPIWSRAMSSSACIGKATGGWRRARKCRALEDEYRLSGDRPKLIYIKAPAPNRQPRLTEMIARIQGADVSYRPFGSADELRTLVADDLAVLLTERFAASAETRRSRPDGRPSPRCRDR